MMPQNNALSSLLDSWLQARLPQEVLPWIAQRCEQISAGKLQELYLGFGLVSRKIPKQALELTTDERQQAEAVRSGWQPQYWSLPDAVRMRLILAYPAEDAAALVTVLDRLFAAGEVHELMALYQGLPLFPFPQAHVDRAGEGIRTNMLAVFKAVAHHNPYPSEQLPDGMWNQLILKCLFVGASLYPVVGLQARNNPALTGMLCDYAHERWAAKRTISPELWRCVDPVYQESALQDLQRVLETGTETEQAAAALALAASSAPAAHSLLAKSPEWTQKITTKEWTWQRIAEQQFA